MKKFVFVLLALLLVLGGCAEKREMSQKIRIGARKMKK